MVREFLRKIISSFCICRNCLTYPKGEGLKTYCEFGKSDKEIRSKGCICSRCIVWKVNKFHSFYYCIKGKDEKSKI